MAECVKVVVRCRPMNTKEKGLNCNKIVIVDQSLFQIRLKKPDHIKDGDPDYEPKAFTFDGVYDDDSKQVDVYNDTAYPLVKSVMDGYNGTIFAYGQTGCGKTFTMQGVADVPHLRGIIPSTFKQIMDAISLNPDPNKKFLVQISFLEIYNEEVRDLLSDNPKQKLDIKEDTQTGIFVKGLRHVVVENTEQMDELMNIGNGNRSVGATAMNADSSRSHSIFTIRIETSEPVEGTTEDEVKVRAGKLNLVDLAGSERQSKTQAEGTRLKEATKINLSLSALGNVISALVSAKDHIPYRDSKLTRLLQDSLGGNTKTIMIAALSPADYNYDETLSTLRYANRAKNIKNKPRINEDPKDALLREYQEEIKRLKLLLEQKGISLDGLMAAAAATASPTTTSSARQLPPATTSTTTQQQPTTPTAATTTTIPEEQQEEQDDSKPQTQQQQQGQQQSQQQGQQQPEQQQQQQQQQQQLEPQQEPEHSVLEDDAEELLTTTTTSGMSQRQQQQLEQQQQQLQEDLNKMQQQQQQHTFAAKQIEQQLQQRQQVLQQEIEEERKKLQQQQTTQNNNNSQQQGTTTTGTTTANNNSQQQQSNNNNNNNNNNNTDNNNPPPVPNKQTQQLLQQLQDKEKQFALITQQLQQDQQRHETTAKALEQQMQQEQQRYQQLVLKLQQQQQEQQQTQQEQQQRLQQKLKKLQQKVLAGGQKLKNIKEQQLQQLREVEQQQRQQQVQQRQQQLFLEQQKQKMEEENLLLVEATTTTQQALEQTTSKIKKLQKKVVTLKQELKENEREWEKEKESYLIDIKNSNREAKLYQQLTQLLLSPPDLDKILAWSHYDEDTEMWKLPKIEWCGFLPAVHISSPTTTATTTAGYSPSLVSSSVSAWNFSPTTTSGIATSRANSFSLSSTAATTTNNNSVTNRNTSRQQTLRSRASVSFTEGSLNNSDPTAADYRWKKPTTIREAREEAFSGGSLGSASTNPTSRPSSQDYKQSKPAFAPNQPPPRATNTSLNNTNPSLNNTMVLDDYDPLLSTESLPKRPAFEQPTPTNSNINGANSNDGTNVIDLIQNLPLSNRPAFAPQALASPSAANSSASNEVLFERLPPAKSFTPAASPASLTGGSGGADVVSAALSIDISTRKSFQPATSTFANVSKQQPSIDDILAKAPQLKPNFVPAK